ncbi:MAG: amidohydrolase family protein, partial [Ruthenibacterium sp.]
MMGKTLIKNGLVVNAGGCERQDVLMDGGKITQLEPHIYSADAQLVDATGLLVLPGGVDAHVHISRKENKADDFYSGSCCALQGGTTTVIDFCEPYAQEEALACIRDTMALCARGAVDYTFHFAFTEDWEDQLAKLDEITALGLRSFKI